MALTRIVAVIVDTKQLTLYKDDGKTIVIPQGDPRVRPIIDRVLPIVEIGGIAEVDLNFPNYYREFEEQAGGLVRFFRVAKKAVSHIFGSTESEPVPEGTFGVLPASLSTIASAVDEIIANAQPVNSDDYSSEDTRPDETMIAVVGNASEGQKVIPGVEALADQFAHSARNRSTIGVRNLLKRMAAVIDKRAHSVEDLLRFLEKGDLPIADDGSIVAYKRLYRHKERGYFVDPHTRMVKQRVGSFVCVSEDLVDKNRRNECSNGLHIGRRGYMGNFYGDTIVICKIAPEDVIVVPHNDPNKVRVCGYHIVAELSSEAFQAVKANQPMTQIKGMPQLLARILRGEHIRRIEEVRITKEQGKGLVITPLGKNGKPQRPASESSPTRATALDDKVNDQGAHADPRQVSAQVQQATISRREQARLLWNVIETSTDPKHRIKAAQDLVALKKRTKVSWDTLDISSNQAAKAMNIASDGSAEMASTPAPTPTPAPVKTEVKKPKAEKPKTQPIPVPKPAAAPVNGSRQERAAALMAIINSTASAVDRGLAAVNLMSLKRTSKVSYAKLGVDISEDELKKIAEAGSKATARHEPGQPLAGKKATMVVVDELASDTPASTKSSSTGAGSRIETARALFDAQDWTGLAAHKRKTRIGWNRLGFTDKEITEIKLHIGS